jgi:hypothetical protein
MPRRYLLIWLVAVLLPVGACSSLPRVRAILDHVLADPAAFEDCELIITADIADVLERYPFYHERRVEVTGTVAYYGRQSFWTWYIMLADHEHTLRCYTNHYRLKAGRDAETMLLRAFADRKPLTVNGVLRKDGIDIREVVYEGQVVRPDFKPPEAAFYPGVL